MEFDSLKPSFLPILTTWSDMFFSNLRKSGLKITSTLDNADSKSYEYLELLFLYSDSLKDLLEAGSLVDFHRLLAQNFAAALKDFLAALIPLGPLPPPITMFYEHFRAQLGEEVKKRESNARVEAVGSLTSH